ncbi:hypothetical protein DM860_007737 [Cuscuta australis]|uniref:Uncharacterized protein n=1 Tax=Cuscuta australis TaxID=267555 RepID=A0A328E8N3_9ASTE|nr:hypothetical protein DM860_007737 [Cuscuta australis]
MMATAGAGAKMMGARGGGGAKDGRGGWQRWSEHGGGGEASEDGGEVLIVVAAGCYGEASKFLHAHLNDSTFPYPAIQA